jgi:hypothetical protein
VFVPGLIVSPVDFAVVLEVVETAVDGVRHEAHAIAADSHQAPDGNRGIQRHGLGAKRLACYGRCQGGQRHQQLARSGRTRPKRRGLRVKRHGGRRYIQSQS